ncbi:MAG: EamA family transporter, partial [Candidatus Hydrogenedentes bacterium]|nr:EamA family transporter [Candidatus Hydrogenedentota bacterium]
MPASSSHHSIAATGLGMCSILFWGGTVAFARSLSEQVGIFTAAALTYGIASVLAWTALAVRRPGAVKRVFRLPRAYLLGCGAVFVVYLVSFYLAIGLAVNRQQVVEIGLVNYLWPSLTLALSIPLLGKKAGVWLAVGMALGFGGIALAMTQSGPFSWEVLAAN